MARGLGKVFVRKYAGDQKGTEANKRVIVDFDYDETTTRYLVLSDEGATLRLGVEILSLDWVELVKLTKLIASTGRELSKRAAS